MRKVDASLKHNFKTINPEKGNSKIYAEEHVMKRMQKANKEQLDLRKTVIGLEIDE